MFEFDSSKDELFWIEGEKSKEHDSGLAGCDFNLKLGLIVTADVNGVVRLWTKNKKFIREIQFPGLIDSVAFLNTAGDLLVSHAERISKIRIAEYWTKTFDYFGITRSADDPELAQIARDNASIFED